MPKKKEAGKSTDNGKGKGKASASPSSTQAQSARDIGATFLGADDDDAGSDLTVEGVEMFFFNSFCSLCARVWDTTDKTHAHAAHAAHARLEPAIAQQWSRAHMIHNGSSLFMIGTA